MSCTTNYTITKRLLTIKLIHMKTKLFVLACVVFINTHAQNNTNLKAQNQTATILSMDAQGVNFDDKQMGSLLRLELEKLDTFQVVDRYDINYFMEKKAKQIYDSLYKNVYSGNARKADSCFRKVLYDVQYDFNNCFSKSCLVEMGNVFNSDKMLTGTAERFGEIVVITLRLIDVKSASIEKTQVNEYLHLPNEAPLMIRLSLLQLFNKPYDKELLKTISKKNNYESAINNHNKISVNLNGPRSGFTVFTGETAKIIEAPKEKGGFGAYPVMFQFGYQFEKQYLNEGSYQALFEFLPTITGFNQNVFIPSLTIMNGFRENKFGWEIGFGPSFSIVTKANGYYDASGEWQLEKKWNTDQQGVNPNTIINRLDSRGNPELNSFFIVALGKTFRSGRLNIPVNVYYVPSKDGDRFGLSVGFNAKRKV